MALLFMLNEQVTQDHRGSSAEPKIYYTRSLRGEFLCGCVHVCVRVCE